MELLIPLNNSLKIPLYEQIYEFVKGDIERGYLRIGMRLPSTRNLANQLKVSRSTVQMAYDQLVAEGYIESIAYKGYFISGVDVLHATTVAFKVESQGLKKQEDPYLIDFSPRGIDLESVPVTIWGKLSRQVLNKHDREVFLAGESQGEYGLREEICKYLHRARGVISTPEQIVLGAGSEYLLMLLSHMLGQHQVIAMENPTYRQAYRILCNLGHQVVSIPMDHLGIHVESLKKEQVDMAYVMPSHQYPTGIVMPVKRRQELLSWAYEREGRYLIEDDYNSEFRYKGKPIPALQGMDHRGRVIYLGTCSRAIAPALRIGYLVLPKTLLEPYERLIQFYSSTVSRIDQKILECFMEEGFYERHLNRMRTVYKNKQALLLQELKPLLQRFEIRGEHAGLHLLLTDQLGEQESTLIEQVASYGVKVYGYSENIVSGKAKECSTIMIGYANLSQEELVRGARILCQVFGVKKE